MRSACDDLTELVRGAEREQGQCRRLEPGGRARPIAPPSVAITRLLEGRAYRGLEFIQWQVCGCQVQHLQTSTAPLLAGVLALVRDAVNCAGQTISRMRIRYRTGWPSLVAGLKPQAFKCATIILSR